MGAVWEHLRTALPISAFLPPLYPTPPRKELREASAKGRQGTSGVNGAEEAASRVRWSG